MQSQSWSISSKDFVPDHDDDDEEIPSNKHAINPVNEEEEEDEDEEKTVRPSNTFKTARQTMFERKLQQADNRNPKMANSGTVILSIDNLSVKTLSFLNI